MMKRFVLLAVASICIFSCADPKIKGKFVVKGEIKNAPDQKLILEEVFFDNSRNPEIVDSADLKDGKFTTEATAPGEGLYRIRMEKEKAAFIFINDQAVIPFVADLKNLTFKTILFNSPANKQLKDFIVTANEKEQSLRTKAGELEQYNGVAMGDSLVNIKRKIFEEELNGYKKFIYDNIESSTNPIVALFGLGYTRELEKDKLEKLIQGLGKKFPKNETVKGVIASYNKAMTETKQQEAQQPGQPTQITVGSIAPELTMPDVNDKPLSLSSFRGKYVLVDFWASWCGPCRAANPNLVSAYNMFKDKNFTILGVSLDRNKSAWLKAISDDNLTWAHISDLKFWGSAAASIYGFDAIPFNVLVDPQGKIAAINLEGRELQAKLAAVLK